MIFPIYRKYRLPGFFIAGVVALLYACQETDEPMQAPTEEPAFELLGAEQTGLDFVNALESTTDFNVFHYMYFYNGGGVSVADFNQDGLVDIFFTGNQVHNRLYLNTGDLHFKDVTEAAGLAGLQGWTCGTTAVDINQDGLMDLYVSQLGDFRSIKGKNQLYVCQGIDAGGIPQFADEAAAYGLDLVGFGTQACFFDYDLDGDLDMFQLNHSVHNNGTFGQRKTFLGTYHPLSGDRMFRNDSGKYTEVTRTCGIQSSVIGYGLGVACGDIDLDGWPDLYICNDFHENDYLYINQHDGTFREVLTEEIMHTSRFSMGVDIADINNDGYSEIFTLDMHPYDPHILKSSLGDDGYGTFQFKLGYGYNYQYARNSLQLNNKNQTFSEIGALAGVYATDWSWAALFLDFDDDGNKDLFVSNGIPKRMNDIDYVNFMSNDEVQWKIKTDNMEQADLALEQKLPEIRIPNKFFHNTGHLGFSEIKSIRNEKPGFSNGAAYADFDNDGDLDIVVNNIDDVPYLYRNLKTEESTKKNSYLALDLVGPKPNIQAIGARVIAYRGASRLVDENFPVAGYQSSVQYGIHLGLGDLESIDSIHLIWPDRTYERIGKDQCNQRTKMTWSRGLPLYDFSNAGVHDSIRAQLSDISGAVGLDFTHRENDFVEFDREQLIPHMTSAEGPALAVGDVNGDGLEDVFVGGAKWEQCALFFQRPDGKFEKSEQPGLVRDSIHEDVDAAFADFDGDGALDLVIASGGNEFRNDAEALRQRLYFNDGAGVFVRDTTVFRGVYLTAACVAVRDFDGDGDMDIFLGGRAVPWHYGVFPKSYLFRNEGDHRFTDVTDAVCPALREPGLVRDAQWADVNNDGKPDLIIAVEWGPIQVFTNSGNTMRQRSLEGSNGIWNFIDAADLDGDGDVDFIAGNLGLNSKLHATADHPLKLCVGDFDNNGQIEQLMTYYIGEREVVFPTYAEITKQLPEVKKQYLFAKDFADASLEDLVGKDQLAQAACHNVYVTENSWFENRGKNTFVRHALPRQLQFAPLRTSLMQDFDGDGFIDILLLGNFYEANVEMGRYDADYGNILFGGRGGPDTNAVQQLKITGQCRKVRSVHAGENALLVIARNNAPMVIMQYTERGPVQ